MRVGGLVITVLGYRGIFQGGITPPTGWLDKPLVLSDSLLVKHRALGNFTSDLYSL